MASNQKWESHALYGISLQQEKDSYTFVQIICYSCIMHNLSVKYDIIILKGGESVVGKLKQWLVRLMIKYGYAGAYAASHHGGYEPPVPQFLKKHHK